MRRLARFFSHPATLLVMGSILMGLLDSRAQTPAPTPPAKTYALELCSDSTELTKACSQTLRMQTAVKDVQIAQRDYSAALQSLQKANGEVAAQSAAIDKENGWPETVQFNLQTGTFADTKPPESVKAPPAKP